MTRKDTILIAVVINAGLLAILFTTAIIYDADKGTEQIEFTSPLVENKTSSSEEQSNLIAAASTGDEVDNVLKYYTSPAAQPLVVSSQSESYIPLQSHLDDEERADDSPSKSTQDGFIEVKVKQGDMLEKIARANKTTVGAIRRANQLTSEKLSIGQVLKIPTKQISLLYANSPAPEPKIEAAEPEKDIKKEVKAAEPEPVFYVIKSGDNPWKIAKQHGVKYEEILRLNHMSEEKARNLKIGDQIRIK